MEYVCVYISNLYFFFFYEGGMFESEIFYRKVYFGNYFIINNLF